MKTAAEVAQDLRKVVEALEAVPDAEVSYAFATVHVGDNKDAFMALAKVWPRPFEKKPDPDGPYAELKLNYNKHYSLTARRSSVCTLVEEARPARYECPTLLSAEEEEALGQF